MSKILLVDDDVDLVLAYRIVLTQRGHEVAAAHSATEARPLLKAARPDALVLDIMMESDTAGLELARDAHAMYPDLPMLMVSGIQEHTGKPFRFADDESFLPAVKFVDKPIGPARLADEVQAMLEQAVREQ